MSDRGWPLTGICWLLICVVLLFIILYIDGLTFLLHAWCVWLFRYCLSRLFRHLQSGGACILFCMSCVCWCRPCATGAGSCLLGWRRLFSDIHIGIPLPTVSITYHVLHSPYHYMPGRGKHWLTPPVSGEPCHSWRRPGEGSWCSDAVGGPSHACLEWCIPCLLLFILLPMPSEFRFVSTLGCSLTHISFHTFHIGGLVFLQCSDLHSCCCSCLTHSSHSQEQVSIDAFVVFLHSVCSTFIVPAVMPVRFVVLLPPLHFTPVVGHSWYSVCRWVEVFLEFLFWSTCTMEYYGGLHSGWAGGIPTHSLHTTPQWPSLPAFVVWERWEFHLLLCWYCYILCSLLLFLLIPLRTLLMEAFFWLYCSSSIVVNSYWWKLEQCVVIVDRWPHSQWPIWEAIPITLSHLFCYILVPIWRLTLPGWWPVGRCIATCSAVPVDPIAVELFGRTNGRLVYLPFRLEFLRPLSVRFIVILCWCIHSTILQWH